jgi:hypothetical protein
MIEVKCNMAQFVLGFKLFRLNTLMCVPRCKSRASKAVGS